MLQDLEIIVKLRTSQSAFAKSLDRYQQISLLGTGGFSEVYKAICKNTGCEVALKLIEKSVIKNHEGLRGRVLQEINIQCLLNHPAVLKLYTVFEDDNYVCLVLEFCSNGDLASIVKKGISEKNVKSMMKQIVDGLQYLHSENIVHRDLKLANILLDEHHRIKIADFGLATRITYPGEPHKTMCGTANYICPEIVEEQSHGLEADLWSLGCVFYTLLVGKPPFESDSPFHTMNRVTSGNYLMPPGLPKEAQNLISRLLQKVPSFRITLDEIRNHPYFSENSMSPDSGVDTYSGSSGHLINKLNSVNSNQPYSNYSNGYVSFETPKSSRRCKSQDRYRNNEPTRTPLYNVNPLYADTIFFPDNKYHTSKISNCLSKGTADFSPGRQRNGFTDDHIKRKCEIFCENEILKHTDCDCLKCKRRIDLEDPTKPPKAILQKNVVNAQTHQRRKSVSDSDGAEERVKVMPFSTERLNPTRTVLKNVVLSILENGDVCVERLKSNKAETLVVEVVLITGNGLMMQIYYPGKGHGVPFNPDHPSHIPLNGADAIFNCSTLSKENWKKYEKAARYVDMVKSKTPKLTLYTAKAKCLLMENTPQPDFQVIYYDDIKKITKSRKGIVMMNCGKEYELTGDTWSNNSADNSLREYYNYFQECYRRCCFLEAQLSSLSLSSTGEEFKVFPAILGKKSTCRLKDSVWDSCVKSPHIFHSTKYST